MGSAVHKGLSAMSARQGIARYDWGNPNIRRSFEAELSKYWDKDRNGEVYRVLFNIYTDNGFSLNGVDLSEAKKLQRKVDSSLAKLFKKQENDKLLKYLQQDVLDTQKFLAQDRAKYAGSAYGMGDALSALKPKLKK